MQLAQSQVDIAKAQLESADIGLENQSYIATERHQVTQIAIEKGAVIAPNTVLMQLADPHYLKVEIRVKEFDAPWVKVGQIAWVTLPTNKQISIKSKVTHIQPILEKIGETYAMKAVVEFTATQNTFLKPGNQVNVQIITGFATNVWTIPQKGVQFENGLYFVTIQTPQGSQKVQVQVGLQNATDIEIKSGLNPQQKVLLL